MSKFKYLLESFSSRQELWNALFEYKDGELFYKNRELVNYKERGPLGYRQEWLLAIFIKDKTCFVHRIIYEMFHGDTDKEIDHINNDSFDNHIENLREATHQQNVRNIEKPCTNKSGYKGVCWHKGSQKWHAQISINNTKKSLGYFYDILAAKAAYDRAASATFGEFFKP